MDYNETSKNVFQSEGMLGLNDWEEIIRLGKQLEKPVAILDLRNFRYPQLNKPIPDGWADIWMPIPDQPFEVVSEFKALDFFRTAGRVAQAYYESGYILWILCAAGISRSTTANIAFRMMTYKEDRDTAFRAIQKVRSCVGPNVFFWMILLKLEEELHGEVRSSMSPVQMYSLCS